MQKYTNGAGITVLMMDEEELKTPEGQAAAVSTLDDGDGVTVKNLLTMKKRGEEVVMLSNGREATVVKTSKEVVAAILAYKTPDRIFAYLAV